jgi:hypothetical protein
VRAVRAVLMTFVEQYARKFYPEEVERHLNPPAPAEGNAGGTAAGARPDATAAEEPNSAESVETRTPAPVDSNTAAAADSKEETGTSHGPTPASDKPRERAPKLFNIFDSGGPVLLLPACRSEFHFGSLDRRCDCSAITHQESAGCSSCR